MKYYNDVKQFHDKFGMVTPPSYVLISPDLHQFRANFFDEEFTEYVESVEETLDLPTAIDSLIDLVYITMGTTLLHGISPDIYNSCTNKEVFTTSITDMLEKPHFLKLQEHHALKLAISKHITSYRNAYVRGSQELVEDALNGLFFSCINGAVRMGFYEKRWNLMWDDVQRANMSKERAVREDQSKRKSTHDVFKPVGWVGPRGEQLIEMMLKGEA